jgi:NAD(P)-dependent dehydrogenase (short-subunit alcohol dehydrogenase family)
MTDTQGNMHDKVCLVTGATDGIGKVTARVLVERGAHVIVVGRKQAKTEKVVAEIKQKTGRDTVDYLLADFASLAETRQLVAQFQARYDRLDVLVNNAGTMLVSRQETADHLETTFAVNHLGYFLLTNLLLDVLIASAPARIINVCSDAHVGRELDFDDLQMVQHYQGMEAYGRSKLANLYFTYELARRLDGTGVTVNTVHPGFVGTNIGADNIPLLGKPIKWLINLLAMSPEKGAQTSIYLATSPEVTGVTGKYFVNCQPIPSSPISYDETAARRLWQISEELAGLT